MAKIKLELHNVIHKGQAIEVELSRAVKESVESRVAFLEIVFDKDNRELKKRVLRFLAQPKMKRLYHRVEKDDKNFGRIFAHFRPCSNRKKIGLYGISPSNSATTPTI